MPSNLPNLLTLSRIAAIPLLVALMAFHTAGADLAACALFAVAGFTDWLDGRIARQRKLQSELGRMLDPIADKLLVGATLMALAGMNRLSSLGLYPAIVIMCREILVSGLREYLAGLAVRLPVTRLAKWKTGLQMAAIGILLASVVPVGAIGEAMLWVAALLTLVTGWDYLLAGLSSVVSLQSSDVSRSSGANQSSALSRRSPEGEDARSKAPAAPELFLTTDD